MGRVIGPPWGGKGGVPLDDPASTERGPMRLTLRSTLAAVLPIAVGAVLLTFILLSFIPGR